MKASELMIGDWVTVRRPSNRREKVRVKSVIGNGTIEAKTSDGLVALGELVVEPIPLTKEILEKNGWSEDWHFFPEDKDFFLELHIDGNRVLWTINSWEYDIMPLEYVHKLQHTLKLCRIEKEIINL